LTGRAGSIIDQNPLAEPQVRNVLLAPDMLCVRALAQGANREGG
jgi:hypothetical protein